MRLVTVTRSHNLLASSRQPLTRDLILGVSASVLASALVYALAKLFAASNPLLPLVAIVACFSLVVATALYVRLRRVAVPGLLGWFADRADADYVYHILQDVERSFEVMTCTGSSTFVQGGRLLNALQVKYKTNAIFETKVLLIDPEATELMAYRQRKLGSEPNVLAPKDVQETLRVLKQAHDTFVSEPGHCLDVRTYANELVWHVMIIDRRLALLSFYGPGKCGWKWPVLVFEKKDGSLYYGIEEQFDQRWVAAAKCWQ